MQTPVNTANQTTGEIPFPQVLLDGHVSQVTDGSDVFEVGNPLQLGYAIDSDGGYARPEMAAKPDGGTDAKRGKKEKPKGHTDGATHRK